MGPRMRRKTRAELARDDAKSVRDAIDEMLSYLEGQSKRSRLLMDLARFLRRMSGVLKTIEAGNLVIVEREQQARQRKLLRARERDKRSSTSKKDKTTAANSSCENASAEADTDRAIQEASNAATEVTRAMQEALQRTSAMLNVLQEYPREEVDIFESLHLQLDDVVGHMTKVGYLAFATRSSDENPRYATATAAAAGTQTSLLKTTAVATATLATAARKGGTEEIDEELRHPLLATPVSALDDATIEGLRELEDDYSRRESAAEAREREAAAVFTKLLSARARAGRKPWHLHPPELPVSGIAATRSHQKSGTAILPTLSSSSAAAAASETSSTARTVSDGERTETCATVDSNTSATYAASTPAEATATTTTTTATAATEESQPPSVCGEASAITARAAASSTGGLQQSQLESKEESAAPHDRRNRLRERSDPSSSDTTGKASNRGLPDLEQTPASPEQSSTSTASTGDKQATVEAKEGSEDSMPTRTSEIAQSSRGADSLEVDDPNDDAAAAAAGTASVVAGEPVAAAASTPAYEAQWQEAVTATSQPVPLPPTPSIPLSIARLAKSHGYPTDKGNNPLADSIQLMGPSAAALARRRCVYSVMHAWLMDAAPMLSHERAMRLVVAFVSRRVRNPCVLWRKWKRGSSILRDVINNASIRTSVEEDLERHFGKEPPAKHNVVRMSKEELCSWQRECDKIAAIYAQQTATPRAMDEVTQAAPETPVVYVNFDLKGYDRVQFPQVCVEIAKQVGGHSDVRDRAVEHGVMEYLLRGLCRLFHDEGLPGKSEEEHRRFRHDAAKALHAWTVCQCLYGIGAPKMNKEAFKRLHAFRYSDSADLRVMLLRETSYAAWGAHALKDQLLHKVEHDTKNDNEGSTPVGLQDDAQEGSESGTQEDPEPTLDGNRDTKEAETETTRHEEAVVDERGCIIPFMAVVARLHAPSDAEFAFRCCSPLCVCSILCQGGVSGVADQGISELLLTHILDPHGARHPRLAEEVCRSISNICFKHTGFCSVLANAGACELLMTRVILPHSMEHVTVAENGWAAIANILRAPALAPRLASAGAVERSLTYGLRPHGTYHGGVTEWVCRIIVSMCQHEEYQDRYGQAGACELTQTHIFEPHGTRSSQVAEQACRVVCSLAKHHVDNQRRLGEAGVCESVISHAFKLYAQKEARLAEVGCCAMAYLAYRNRENQKRLLNAGACELIVKNALVPHGATVPAVAEQACIAITMLSTQNEGVQDRFLKAGALAAITEHALEPNASRFGTVARFVCTSVTSVARAGTRTTKKKRHIANDRLCDSLVSHILEPHGHRDVCIAREACSTIRALCAAPSNLERFHRQGTVGKVLQALSAHAEVPGIAELRDELVTLLTPSIS